MSEPRMVREQELEPEVDFYGMCLQDEESAQVAYPGGRVMDEGVFLTAHPGRVDIESAGHTHTPTMTAQVWDGEPPVDTSRAWEQRADTTVRSATGTLQVWGVFEVKRCGLLMPSCRPEDREPHQAVVARMSSRASLASTAVMYAYTA